jgi:hypothetical protein
VLNLIKKYISLLRQNRKIATILASIIYTVFRYLIYQAEYYKGEWKQERILHQADNKRCREQLQNWETRDSIRDQQLWDKAMNNAKERILQPAIDSIAKL